MALFRSSDYPSSTGAARGSIPRAALPNQRKERTVSPKLDEYEVEFEDGTIRHQQLDSDGADELKEIAKNKASDIKSVKKGKPDVINPPE